MKLPIGTENYCREQRRSTRQHHQGWAFLPPVFQHRVQQEEPSNIENMRKLFPFPTSESKTRALGSSVRVVRGLWQKIPSDISDTWHKVFALCPRFHRKVMPAAAIYLWDSPSSSVPPSSVSSERTLLKNLPLFSSN